MGRSALYGSYFESSGLFGIYQQRKRRLHIPYVLITVILKLLIQYVCGDQRDTLDYGDGGGCDSLDLPRYLI